MNKGHWMWEIIRRLTSFRGAGLLLVVLTAGAGVLGALPPLLIGRIIDEALPDANVRQLALLAGGVLGALVAVEVLMALRQYVASGIVLQLNRNLRLDVYRSVLKTQVEFLKTTPRGDILQRCVDDAESLQSFSLDTLPTSLQELISAVVAVGVIARIYWPLGILGALVYSLYLLPVRYFGNLQRQVVADLRNQNALLHQVLQENLETVRLIKTFGAEEREYQRVQSLQHRWAELVLRRYVTENMFRNFPRVLDALAPALVFALGGWQVFAGRLTVGDLVTITGLLPAVNAPLRSFSATFLALKDVGARLERVVEYLALPVESGQRGSLKPVEQIQGHIEFHHVSYHSVRGTVLSDVSFTIQPGEHVAIVGRSGAGKSTILQLIVRLLEPSSGTITIDGQPLAELDAASLRGRIGIVPQEPVIFNTTIAENLRYVGRNESETEVAQVAHLTGADDFISALENGYETVVGEKGVTLSGGQRQRLAICRALLGKPDVLILDEVLSVGDAKFRKKSEKRILDMFDKGATVLFVSHVTEQVMAICDRAIILDKGRLVANGPAEEICNLYDEKFIGVKKDGKETVKNK